MNIKIKNIMLFVQILAVLCLGTIMINNSFAADPISKSFSESDMCPDSTGDSLGLWIDECEKDSDTYGVHYVAMFGKKIEVNENLDVDLSDTKEINFFIEKDFVCSADIDVFVPKKYLLNLENDDGYGFEILNFNCPMGTSSCGFSLTLNRPNPRKYKEAGDIIFSARTSANECGCKSEFDKKILEIVNTPVAVVYPFMGFGNGASPLDYMEDDLPTNINYIDPIKHTANVVNHVKTVASVESMQSTESIPACKAYPEIIFIGHSNGVNGALKNAKRLGKKKHNIKISSVIAIDGVPRLHCATFKQCVFKKPANVDEFLNFTQDDHVHNLRVLSQSIFRGRTIDGTEIDVPDKDPATYYGRIYEWVYRAHDILILDHRKDVVDPILEHLEKFSFRDHYKWKDPAESGQNPGSFLNCIYGPKGVPCLLGDTTPSE